jgi:hypothetical protein
VKLTANQNAVALQAVIIGGVTALLTFLSAFNIWSPTDEQITAILGLITAMIAFGAYWSRGKVYAEDTVHPDVGDTGELPPGFDA